MAPDSSRAPLSTPAPTSSRSPCCSRRRSPAARCSAETIETMTRHAVLNERAPRIGGSPGDRRGRPRARVGAGQGARRPPARRRGDGRRAALRLGSLPARPAAADDRSCGSRCCPSACCGRTPTSSSWGPASRTRSRCRSPASLPGGALDCRGRALRAPRRAGEGRAESDVDVVLTGTCCRPASAARRAQLVEAPGGDVLVALGRRRPGLFEIQDGLVRQIVDSLRLPLSARERGAISRDVPASATAYEFFLRANRLSLIGPGGGPRPLPPGARRGPVVRAGVGAAGPRYPVIAEFRGDGRRLHSQRIGAEPGPRTQPGSLDCRSVLRSARGRGSRSRPRSHGAAGSARLVTWQRPNCLPGWSRPAGIVACFASIAAADRPTPRSDRANQRAAHVLHDGGLPARRRRVRTAPGRPGNIGALDVDLCAGHPDAARLARGPTPRATRTRRFSKQRVDHARTRSGSSCNEPSTSSIRVEDSRSRRPVLSGPEVSSRRRRGSRRRDPRGRRRPGVLSVRNVHAPRLARSVARFVRTSTPILKKAESRHKEARAAFVNAGGRRCSAWKASRSVAL